MQLSFIQILILSIYPGVAQTDESSWASTMGSPLFSGFFTGLVIGNIPLGIAVGGTLQLMSLGLGTYGGASIPDYLVGSVIGTVFAHMAAGPGAPLEESLTFALTVAIPVGLLLIQMDIFRRTFNVFWQHMADRAAETRQYGKIKVALYLGMITSALSRSLPCFIALLFGEPVVELVTEGMPMWLMNGLKTAGGLLPAMGMAILMRYLPFRKYFAFYIVGFVLFAYGGSMFNMVAISLLGLAAASVYLMLKQPEGAAAASSGDDMEVEIDE